MPPRLHELAERVAKRTLALLFPHFAAEVGGRAGDVAEELARLEKELADVLRLPETHCSSPDAVLGRFIGALPAIRDAAARRARRLPGDPAARSVDEVMLPIRAFGRPPYRIAHQLQALACRCWRGCWPSSRMPRRHRHPPGAKIDAASRSTTAPAW